MKFLLFLIPSFEFQADYFAFLQIYFFSIFMKNVPNIFSAFLRTISSGFRWLLHQFFLSFWVTVIFIEFFFLLGLLHVFLTIDCKNFYFKHKLHFLFIDFPLWTWISDPTILIEHLFLHVQILLFLILLFHFSIFDHLLIVTG